MISLMHFLVQLLIASCPRGTWVQVLGPTFPPFCRVLTAAYLIRNPFFPTGIPWRRANPEKNWHHGQSSYLLQFENFSNMRFNLSLMAVLKSRGNRGWKERELLFSVPTPIYSHGRHILQKQQVGWKWGDCSSSKAHHHNPALPSQTARTERRLI